MAKKPSEITASSPPESSPSSAVPASNIKYDENKKVVKPANGIASDEATPDVAAPAPIKSASPAPASSASLASSVVPVKEPSTAVVTSIKDVEAPSANIPNTMPNDSKPKSFSEVSNDLVRPDVFHFLSNPLLLLVQILKQQSTKK